VAAGLDYAFAPGWLIGAAASVGTTKQKFDIGGDFRLNEYSVSGYLSARSGPAWASFIGSYGGLRYDVHRIVPIGITTIDNSGETKGHNTSFAAEIGYDFGTPVASAVPTRMPVKAPPAPTAEFNITHGPVAGVVVQWINLRGFTETDPFASDSLGAFTALSFAGQTRHSIVTELGYRVKMDMGIWQPYAKLVWNHEFASQNRLVTASLTSIDAPSYSLPAVIFGRDWGTGTVGTTVKLWDRVTGLASFTGQFAERHVTVYGGQVGLNVALHP
jgi:outer membrane lipase/esterase